MSTAETETAVEKELAPSERGDPARTNLAEHVFRFWHHIVSAVVRPEWTKRTEYWSRHTGKYRPGDFIFAEPADRSWWVVYRALEVCAAGVVVEVVFGKETLRYETPPAIKRGPLGQNEDDFTIEISEEAMGTFCVMRTHDSLNMTKGQRLNKGQCADWLRKYLASVRT
jgi:hypothetical protein